MQVDRVIKDEALATALADEGVEGGTELFLRVDADWRVGCL